MHCFVMVVCINKVHTKKRHRLILSLLLLLGRWHSSVRRDESGGAAEKD